VKALLALAKALFASIWTMDRDDRGTILHTEPHSMLARTTKKNEKKLKKRKQEDKKRKKEKDDWGSIVEEVIGRSALHPCNQCCFNTALI
jgi:hypothetical protein